MWVPSRVVGVTGFDFGVVVVCGLPLELSLCVGPIFKSSFFVGSFFDHSSIFESCLRVGSFLGSLVCVRSIFEFSFCVGSIF